jgi:hypothetical protein
MLRVKFSGSEQRKFIQDVLNRINCPSLRELANRLSVNYSTLKNYFNEDRCLPEVLFNDLIYISKINKEDLQVEYLNSSWGQVKGGKKSRRS